MAKQVIKVLVQQTCTMEILVQVDGDWENEGVKNEDIKAAMLNYPHEQHYDPRPDVEVARYGPPVEDKILKLYRDNSSLVYDIETKKWIMCPRKNG